MEVADLASTHHGVLDHEDSGMATMDQQHMMDWLLGSTHHLSGNWGGHQVSSIGSGYN